MQHRAVLEQEQVEQLSNVRIPPHWPNEVMWSSRHFLMVASVMGHIKAIQLM